MWVAESEPKKSDTVTNIRKFRSHRIKNSSSGGV